MMFFRGKGRENAVTQASGKHKVDKIRSCPKKPQKKMPNAPILERFGQHSAA
jgi:hypothetical protein